MPVTVSPLSREQAGADWSDPSFKWQVSGPGAEWQCFATKANATLYARIRRRCSSMREASRLYCEA